MTPTKRAVCTRCLRPQCTCICVWITPTAHEVDVLFLQHPLEIDNVKGSALLLHLSLPHSYMMAGEEFPEETLRALLYAPFPTSDEKEKGDKIIQPLLLYPNTLEDRNIAIPPTMEPVEDGVPVQYRLVVIDGTWRKSRKMLYLNPLLQQLPRLPLSNPPVSHYRIRKAHKPDQLSTYEASCYALMQLERNTEKFQPLLAAFDGFVEQMSRQMDNVKAK